MTNPSILYWKWDETIFENNVFEEKLCDILKRSSFQMIYISFHHMARPFNDPQLLSLIKKCSEMLDSAGRGLLLDIDVRNEMDGFISRYPNSGAGRLYFFESNLDSNNESRIVIENPIRGHTGRKSICTGPNSIVGAWTFTPSGEGRFVSNTLQKAKCEFIDNGSFTEYTVKALPDTLGKKALIAAVYSATIPDLACNDLFSYYEELFLTVKNFPLAGVANDEWGYDLSLRYEDGLFSVNEFPYTSTIVADYEKETGRPLCEDVYYMSILPDGQEGHGYGVINHYIQILRNHMKKGNDWFYEAGKKHFGENTFIGVHPTLWGDPTDFSMDILHNGVDWWEVKRDYAQTDEFVLMPIRLALSHKWNSPCWYNMWYSGNTQQLDTYFTETWNNARYGGKTHYLSYECPNEDGVYKLKHTGELEMIDALERQASQLDDFRSSQPDSRVLVIFGMEAATNWFLNFNAPKVVRNQGRLKDILHFTASLFEQYICDLVPSSEITNGSITLHNGQACYGNQQYDAILYISPECMEDKVYEFLKTYYTENKKLIVYGNCNYWSDGSDAKNEFDIFTAQLDYHLNDLSGIAETVSILRKWNMSKNRSDNGCVYQDNSIVFTAKGVLPTHNYFTLSEEINGHKIVFEGEDYLAVCFDENNVGLTNWKAGNMFFLSIDGEIIKNI